MPRKSSALVFAFLLLFPFPVLAQIVPDNSLGAESSRTIPDTINNLPSDRIEGGANRGVSLFHSFQEFNIGEGRGAYFANPNGILNIFTRVTGGNPSHILGTLGVQGNANLFFLNPKGIVFGPNARLDVRGSFIGSTASGIFFDNGFEFSAADANAVPLLAINIPVGLRFRENPGTIVNTSSVTQVIQGTALPVGLAVPPGQTLALVGGDLTFNNGFASAFSGNIQLGSVASPGLVSFNITPIGLGLDYTNIANFGNIDLSGLSAVTASGPGGGAIAIRGGNVTLRDRASLVSDTLGNINGRDITVDVAQLKVLDQGFISTSTISTGMGGNITIHATESVELRGLGFDNLRLTFLEPVATGKFDFSFRQSGLFSGTLGSGNGGDITIDTKQLTLREGSLLYSPTLGIGAAGNVVIKASESLEVNESGIVVPVFNQGKGGNLTFDTRQLIIGNGSLVSTGTFGSGNGGDIIVKTDSINLFQSREDSPFGTGLATNTVGNTGNAGNIEINTGSLLVERGAKITSTSGYAGSTGVIYSAGRGGNININADSIKVTSISAADTTSRSLIVAGTTGIGQGGGVTINTRRLTVDGGSGIGANTLASGNGENIIVNASESILLSGTSGNNLYPSGLATASGEPLFQAILRLPPPTGAAGNISVTTPRLIIRDGATINVGSLGSGGAGNINIVADSINLENKASIDGATVSGTGANINLQSRDIQLRRGSRITTDAGSSDGGNIRINSDILATLPKENNDITANARTARGGQVTVNVPNIFGFTAINREQARSSLGLTDAEFAALQVNPTSLISTSDIAAISQQAGPALQGAVTFSTTGVNPAQGLISLPQNVVDPARLIAANPCTEGEENEFTVTGKGGVPPNPNDVLSSDATQFNWVEPAAISSQNLPEKKAEIEMQPKAVIPAQGWVIDAQGKVTLVSYNLDGGASARSPKQTGVCVPRR
jgi:filamentous hemagglutinin family protein